MISEYLLSWRITNGYKTETDKEIDFIEDIKQDWQASLLSLPYSDAGWRRLFGFREAIGDKEGRGSTKEEIRAKTDLKELIWPEGKCRRSGNRFYGLCPLHQEKTPSLVVDTEKQLWHCFGCQKGGDCFSFIMHRDDCSFLDALHLLE